MLLNPDAAANQLRQAVESLLTARGERRYTTTKAGKRKRLTTHERIESFRKREPQVSDVLEAVKWIGNAGSHDDALTVGQVAEGAGYLALALRLLYDRTEAALLASAQAVNKRRGVRRAVTSP